MSGVDFGVKTVRVTQISQEGVLGEVLVSHGGKIQITPNIEMGKTKRDKYSSYTSPDQFNWWEFDLSTDLDTTMFLIGSEDVAFEMWTEYLEPEKSRWRRAVRWVRRYLGRRVWIHWVFPRTRWTFRGPGRVSGVSATDSSGRKFGNPEDTDISEGAFWKTTERPPR